MYRVWEQPKEENAIYISEWDGDCFYYTVFESEEEKQAEVERLRKIDEEIEQQKKDYAEYLASLEK